MNILDTFALVVLAITSFIVVTSAIAFFSYLLVSNDPSTSRPGTEPDPEYERVLGLRNINLRQIDAVNWRRTDTGNELIQSARSLKLLDAGAWDIDEMPGTSIHVFVDEINSLAVVIYEYPHSELYDSPYIEVSCQYDDGTVYDCNTLPDYKFEHPEWQKVQRFEPDTSISQMLAYLLSERPEGDLTPVLTTTFKQLYEENFTRASDARARSGISSSHVKTVTMKLGHAPTEEEVGLGKQYIEAALNQSIEAELQSNYADSRGYTTSAWDAVADRIMFIHDRMTPTEVKNTAISLLKCINASSTEEAEPSQNDISHMCRKVDASTPRIAFSEWISEQNHLIKKTDTLSDPIGCDVYHLPAES